MLLAEIETGSEHDVIEVRPKTWLRDAAVDDVGSLVGEQQAGRSPREVIAELVEAGCRRPRKTASPLDVGFIRGLEAIRFEPEIRGAAPRRHDLPAYGGRISPTGQERRQRLAKAAVGTKRGPCVYPVHPASSP
jgi:hypothetical protein